MITKRETDRNLTCTKRSLPAQSVQHLHVNRSVKASDMIRSCKTTSPCKQVREGL